MRLVLLLACLALAGCQPAAASGRVPSFHVEVTGQGRPLILIPGLASSGEVWNGAVKHLASRFECHVLTLAGFAGKPRIERPFLDTVRRDLSAYIRARGWKQKPVLVGHSLGGFLALWLAAEEPELAGPLVIADSLPFFAGTMPGIKTAEDARVQAEATHRMMAGQTREQYERFQRSGMMLRTMVTSPDDLKRAIEWGVQSDPQAVADAMFELMTTDLRPRLSAIQSAALILGTWAGMKEYSTRAEVERVFAEQFAGLKGHRFVMAEEARHFLMLDAPQWFYQQVDAFLSASR